MADQVPGLDLERILPWFREHVEEVDSLTGEIIGHVHPKPVNVILEA